MANVQIKFFTRQDCRLCKEALKVLKRFENRYKLEIKVFDISQSPQLLTEYQYDVPIAILGEEELFRHRANHSKIEAILKTVTAIEKTRKKSK